MVSTPCFHRVIKTQVPVRLLKALVDEKLLSQDESWHCYSYFSQRSMSGSANSIETRTECFRFLLQNNS